MNIILVDRTNLLDPKGNVFFSDMTDLLEKSYLAFRTRRTMCKAAEGVTLGPEGGMHPVRRLLCDTAFPGTGWDLVLAVPHEDIRTEHQFSLFCLTGAFHRFAVWTDELRLAPRTFAFTGLVGLRRRTAAPVPGIIPGTVGSKHKPLTVHDACPGDGLAVWLGELRLRACCFPDTGLEGFRGRAGAGVTLRGNIAIAALSHSDSTRAARIGLGAPGDALHKEQQTEQKGDCFQCFPSSDFEQVLTGLLRSQGRGISGKHERQTFGIMKKLSCMPRNQG